MKKIVACVMIAVALLLGTTGPASAVNKERGGFMGFIAGCCFGIRSGAAYNDGKEIHWRQWVMLVPIANIVVAVWTGIEGYNGMTTQDYADKYGSSFY